MRLLCDEMLKGLARWLRAAGHDTEIAEDGELDRSLIARALADDRLLLTRDRKLLEFRDAEKVVRLLDCNGLDDCARAVSNHLGLDWLTRPFSRCLLCNVPIVPVKQVEGQNIPADVRNQPLWQCPHCQRIYWQGGHVRRMRARLEGWAREGGAS